MRSGFDVTEFGKYIKSERLKKEWSVREFADKVGISVSTIYRIEAGLFASDEIIEKVKDYFNCRRQDAGGTELGNDVALARTQGILIRVIRDSKNTIEQARACLKEIAKLI